jgi:transposase
MKQETVTTESLIEIMNRQLEVIDSKDSIIEQKDKTIADLQQKLDYMLRQKFASSSEKFPSNQPSLFQDALDIETEEETQDEKISYTRKKRGSKKLPPESLPHIRVEHDIAEEDKVCNCGCQLKRIKEISSKQYDIIPAEFRVIDNIRFTYTCSSNCGASPVTSPLTPQVLPRHQVTPSFLATIAVEKFEDAMPLDRQVKKYRQRFGVEFTTTTFSNWMIKTSELRLKPLMERLSAIQMNSGYIQADETTLQVLNEKNKKAKQKSYIWLKTSKETDSDGNDKYPIVLMHYSTNRNEKTAQHLFDGFSGYMQTDGYAGYNIVANQENVTQLGCWAHARRKFADILKSGVSDDVSKRYAKELVDMVAKLYKIEKDIKDDPPDKKKYIREEKSVQIINDIQEWCDKHFLHTHAIGGSIARAFTYLKNQLPKLSVYIEDARLNIDNNIAENHIRPIAIGRKNWLFATSTKGATALCNWYSIIETAKANGLDAYAYLCHILTLLPIYEKEGKNIDELLPWNVTLS